MANEVNMLRHLLAKEGADNGIATKAYREGPTEARLPQGGNAKLCSPNQEMVHTIGARDCEAARNASPKTAKKDSCLFEFGHILTLDCADMTAVTRPARGVELPEDVMNRSLWACMHACVAGLR